jgi:hypothetical protein
MNFVNQVFTRILGKQGDEMMRSIFDADLRNEGKVSKD